MTTSSPDKPIHVLVIDDDVFISDLLQRFLTKQGYRVTLAGDGPTALEILASEAVDIALVDLMLEGMDGITLIGEIKKRQLDLILIMMTGHPTLETALEAMKQGVQDYLIKPFKLEQLSEVIRRCLDERSRRDEIHRLKTELDEAKEQIQRYEILVRHGHRMGPGGERPDEAAQQATGLSTYRQKAEELEVRQEKLIQMRDEGVISEEEFQRRMAHLQAKKTKGY